MKSIKFFALALVLALSVFPFSQEVARAAPGFTCQVTTNSASVNPGSSTTFNINTVSQEGFNSPVSYSASVEPSPANAPSVTIGNNPHQSPYSSYITASVETGSSTPSQSYTITFTGTGGGVTNTCNTQLVVNPAGPDFNLLLTPSPVSPNGIGNNTNPNRTNIGTDVRFQVFAECLGGFAGPITDITSSTTFVGPALTLGATSLECGEATTLTVTNTSSIPSNQQSTVTNILTESIIVNGTGLTSSESFK